MIQQKYFQLIIGFFLLALFSCHKEVNEPLPNDGKVPGLIFNVQVKSLPGGAEITYSLPDDQSIRYVEAEWKTSDNKIRNVKSSMYGISLVLDGFSDVNEHEITLYSVSKGEKKSEPLSVKIKPLPPPISNVFKSLKVTSTFGGCYVSFENPDEANVVIGVITTDSISPNFITAFNFYTKLKKGNFGVRGYKPVKRKFGFFVRDRWDNHSDTLFLDITPVYEEKLDKSKFEEYLLIGDCNIHDRDRVSKLWNNIIGGDDFFHSWISGPMGSTEMPNVSITFSMGVSAVLSRFKLWQRSDENAFDGGNPKKFEVWGTNDVPDADGSYSNWLKLADFVMKKPSGLPVGSLSNDDVAAIQAGQDFDFPPGTPKVKYLRFRFQETWGDFRWVYMSELTFWGQVQ